RTGRGIERVDRAVRGSDVHRVGDHERNRFVLPEAAGKVGGLEVKAPGPLQRRDVGGRDLIERTVSVCALVVVAASPVGRGGCLGDDGGTRSKRGSRQGRDKQV